MFHFPPLAEQESFLKRIRIYDEQLSSLDSELEKQTAYLKELRSSLLQEAIEGRLSADWRAKHPFKKGDPERDAASLLEAIREEKKKLVTAGKIRKEKPLAPIRKGEERFGLPEGWVWCRVAQIVQTYVDCPHATPKYLESGMTCLRSSNICEKGLIFDERRYVSAKEFQERIERLAPARNDIVYIREGGRLGIAGLIDQDGQFCLGQRLMLLRFLTPTTSKFAALYLNSPSVFHDIVEKTLGSAAPHVNVKDVVSHPIPLPPLAEQAFIVARVEALLARVGELEREVTMRRELTEELMREVLREAFA